MRALDAGCRRVLDLIRESGRPPLESLSPQAARAASAASRPLLQPDPPEVMEVRDLAGPVPMRLYRAGPGIRPCLLYLHGGGWVIGDLDSHDQLCRHMALLLDAVVVAVDYRLAPEHVFPAAVEDAALALRWVWEQAEALGIDATRLAVGGDSAGGNLAAVLCLMAREGGLPMPGYQLLLYPVTDLAAESAAYARHSQGYPLTAATMRWFIGHYTPEIEMRHDWRASPLRAQTLSGLPPAFVMTAGHDPLADEGIAYAQRLEDEGVSVIHLHVSDQMHACLTMGRFIPASALVLRQAADALRQFWNP
ncbi:alpha/beta hydrolase [Rhodovarius crocodyli]|uniref:Alpha/beta hydrolase n=1 Tax=Rhodovarius crocodyli TaxID=1979269 RepID=A0A437M1H0_9PROT|nr:alpha/beta hydrolase [Rhodovarius crocodyli]RVT91528.1 alpha/beta hydrolase [Rhodovarius crocodyli]